MDKYDKIMEDIKQNIKLISKYKKRLERKDLDHYIRRYYENVIESLKKIIIGLELQLANRPTNPNR